MEITNNYSSYMTQSIAENNIENSTKKKETEKISKIKNSNSERTSDYVNKLAKLAPSVEFKVGTTFFSGKNGETLTINPKLLEKMQNDPAKEKEMKELIQGVESMTKLSNSIWKASGWKVVYRHSYIDENGKYCHVAYLRNEHGYKMSEKLREERRKNSEKLIEKSKEKIAKKKEELQEKLQEKRIEKEHRDTALDKAKQLLDEKITSSKDGIVYMYDTDIKTIIEATKENSDSTEKNDTKGQSIVGANLDFGV